MTSEAVTHVCNANENFSRELYQILSKNDGNILYSSLSAHSILSLLLESASGETASRLKETLHLHDTTISAKGYQQVMYALNFEENIKLHVANKIFLHEKYSLKEEFANIAKKIFWSEIENISFFPKKAEAAKTINDWIRNETNDKIDRIVSGDILDEHTRVVLVNAIYFNGQWRHQFYKRNTKKENFYISETETIECNMMNIKGIFQYSEDSSLDAQIILLPYKSNNLNMLIILPKSTTNMKALEEKLETLNLRDLSIFSSQRNEVTVSLPKFRIEATIDMKQVLRDMGLDIIFTERCELPNLTTSSQRIYVSSVIQKSYIEVSEEGVEAAAITVVCKRAICKRKKPPPIIFKADHPFFYCIYYSYNEQLLPIFNGKLERPSSF